MRNIIMGSHRQRGEESAVFLTDLAADDRQRSSVEQRKALTILRVEQAFHGPAQAAGEGELAVTVRDFLSAVVNNIESYRNRARVQNPTTGEMLEVDWVELCGTAIGLLEAPLRIKHLVFEYVLALLPDEDAATPRKLAVSAGLPVRPRASADNVRALQRKGLLASLVAKLLVDSKILVWGHDEATATAYFAEAERSAQRLADSPYLTDKDARLQESIRAQYPGGLTELIQSQCQTTVGEIRRRDSSFPEVEKALRQLLEGDFGLGDIEAIAAWEHRAIAGFSGAAYVQTKLDEFRRHLKASLAEAERRRVANHRILVDQARGYLAQRLAQLTRETGIPTPEASESLDLFRLIEDHAATLGSPEHVGRLNDLLDDAALLRHYANLKVSSFKITRPNLRKQIRSDLLIWDELYRTAPLTPSQRARLDDLRQRLIDQLQGTTALDAPKRAPAPAETSDSPFQISIQLLPHLNTESRFDTLLDCVRQVKAVYDETPDDEGRTSSTELAALSPLFGERAGIDATTSALWTPILANPNLWKAEAEAIIPPLPEPPDRPTPRRNRWWSFWRSE